MAYLFKKAKFLSGFFALSFVFFLFSLFFVDKIQLKEINEGVNAQVDSSDAIAFRVIPNPEHYSPLKWYKKQNFTGNPKPMKVDGYEAVKDGRTVYVNAANIVGVDLYTNIYIISYNQEAEGVTSNVFDRILEKWSFNSNIVSTGNCIDAEGSSGLTCGSDDDCAVTEYCDSEKSEITRDVKRLADIRDIEDLLQSYKQKFGFFPKMTAGSYLPQITLSVWPSWQKVLAQKLGGDLPTDPLNRLGDCGQDRFNEITCWDENKKEFAGAYTPAPSYDTLPTLDLSSFSRVYLYRTSANGLSYDLCAGTETTYISGCGSAGDGNIGVVSGNTAPQFTRDNLDGDAGEAFMTYIEGYDIDGDSLSWDIDTSGTNWIASGWSAAPILQVSAATNQATIVADQAGIPGSYTIEIEIDDGRGLSNSVTTRDFTFEIVNQPPIVTSYSSTYPASTTLFISHETIARDSQTLTPNLSSGTIPAGLAPNWSQDPITFDASYRIEGTLNSSNYIPNDTIYPFILDYTDAYGETTSENFSITFTNNKPIMDPLLCNGASRAGGTFLCATSADDPDNNVIVQYNEAMFPPGISINAGTGVISGTFPTSGGSYNISVTAEDEFGAVSDPVYLSLIGGTYCGDGTIQSPNSEGRGGRTDSGFEECEGTTGIANTAAESSATREYSCTGSCPASGDCYNTCSFTGGYCGDRTVNGPEVCDLGGSNTSVPCTAPYASSCTYCDETCNENTVFSMESCGNGSTDGWEECDDAAGGGGGTSIRDQYECNTCRWGGGWCGDGDIQLGNGETCEPGLSYEDYISESGDTISEERYSLLSCTSDCRFGCQADFADIGSGCFMGATCAKGKYGCNNNSLVCKDVYTQFTGTPLYDYCCSGDFNSLTTVGYTLRRGSGTFNCQDVCAGSGEVCIGVGLFDSGNECASIIDHSGGLCAGFNLVLDRNCRANYTTSASLCTEPGSGVGFSVGETGCYCY